MSSNCPYRVKTNTPPRIQLNRFSILNPVSQQLVRSWFVRAYAAKNDEEACFEAFIFAWFAVNGWAACVTGKDRDSEFIKMLQRSDELAAQFQTLLGQDDSFRYSATQFQSFWPIFKAQDIRNRRCQAPSEIDRAAVVAHYFDCGRISFEPDCWQSHREAGEPVPLDWPHTLAAFYRVRCNLFHGEKSAHSEMDRAIVRTAYLTLIGFFRGAGIL